MSKKRLYLLLVFLVPLNCFYAYTQEKKDIDDTTYVINKFIISGNKKTKSHIIKREIIFKTNDTLSQPDLLHKIKKSKENLVNTSLFNFADIYYYEYDSSKVNILVHVVERWYTWPFPIFQISERNFNTWWEYKNFKRVDYGAYITQENFRGRMEKLKLLLRFGYNEKFNFVYSFPYINKKQTLGVTLSTGMKRKHEVAYNTLNNKLLYIKDKNNYLYKNYFGYMEFKYRRKIHVNHTLGLSYENNYFGDTVLSLNNKHTTGGKNTNRFFRLSYTYKNDHRDYKTYPLKGDFFEFSLVKNGLGIFKSHTTNTAYVNSSYRRYFKLMEKLFFSSGAFAKLSAKGHQPYFLYEGLGYNNSFVRGYEYYVIDGEHFGLLKSNLKYELIPRQVINLSFIPTEKFSKTHFAVYSNIFFDAAYVSNTYYEEGNDLTNNLLLGSGIGLDFVTYYDKVLRVEYSVNKLKEAGLFIHFIAPL